MEHKGEKYERLIAPILVGPSARIVSVAEEGACGRFARRGSSRPMKNG
ncbi:hypothetical protein [Burkholderia ubonensis]|nr:hypothetical protein [Burkholderia ubonensis]